MFLQREAAKRCRQLKQICADDSSRIPVAKAVVLYEYDSKHRAVNTSASSRVEIGVFSTPTNKPDQLWPLLNSTYAQCIKLRPVHTRKSVHNDACIYDSIPGHWPVANRLAISLFGNATPGGQSSQTVFIHRTDNSISLKAQCPNVNSLLASQICRNLVAIQGDGQVLHRGMVHCFQQ